jgi:AraC family transcriptional regulator of arabinose operon
MSVTDPTKKAGLQKNRWQGIGRRHIEIPRPILKSRVQKNTWLKQLYISSLGYYPKAEGHYTHRKKGLSENIIFYCIDGHGWYKLGDKQYKVHPNEFFILPENVEHAYGSDEKDPWTIYWMHIGGEQLPYFNSLLSVQEHFKPAYIKSSDEVFSHFSNMYKTLELGYSTDNLIFANMCLTHFLSLFVYNSRHSDGQTSDKMDVVDRAIHYMHEHIKENVSLSDLSQTFHYSASRFSSLFKQKTGYAPIDYFIQMKMQKACHQLDFSDLPIKEIAWNLGFDDPYYFSRHFTKIIGVPPKKYRSIKKD